MYTAICWNIRQDGIKYPELPTRHIINLGIWLNCDVLGVQQGITND